MAQGGTPDLRGAEAALSDPRAGDDGRSVLVIFNPASGRGRGRQRIARYLELLERDLPGARHVLTTHAGEESDLAARAIADGFRTLVAVGGDGTWSHVADRILASGRKDVRFAVLPSGTGNDFGRGLGLAHGDPEEAVRVLASGHTLAIDVGRVLTPASRADLAGRGPSAPRHFLNLVGFGFDIAVIDKAASARFLKGELLYKTTALQQLFRFPGFDAEVRGPDGDSVRGHHLMLTISNGRYFGGGFPIAPAATLTDHLLHACIIGDAPPLERFRLFNQAEKGLHTRSPRVRIIGASRFQVSFAAPPRFEIDGDVFQSAGAEVEVEVLPGALELVAPAAA